MNAEPGKLNSIGSASWLHWPETTVVFSALQAEGHTVRAVGGAVRDALLGRDVADVDMAIDAAPETVMQLASRAGMKVIPTGLDHGTVTVVSRKRPFEVTTLRTDVETYGRRARVAFTDDWEADARRRDFTINALYADADGTLHDPLSGLDDIKKRRIRFIGDPQERIREDFLRILRFFRFIAELETPDIDPDGLSACIRLREGLQQLAPERVHSELCRLLIAPGACRSLSAMFSHGLLVEVLAGVPSLARFKRLIDLEAASRTTPDAMLRLAALNVTILEDAERLGERFRLSNDEREKLTAASHYRVFVPAPSKKKARAWLYRNGRRAFRVALMLGRVNATIRYDESEWQALLKLASEPIPVFPLKGADILEMGVEAGPQIGDILGRIEDAWIALDFNRDRDNLLEMARGCISKDEKT